jgi:hypothetical protein
MFISSLPKRRKRMVRWKDREESTRAASTTAAVPEPLSSMPSPLPYESQCAITQTGARDASVPVFSTARVSMTDGQPFSCPLRVTVTAYPGDVRRSERAASAAAQAAVPVMRLPAMARRQSTTSGWETSAHTASMIVACASSGSVTL